MKLVDLRDLLLTITDKVFHYEASKQKGNYIVWGEDSQANSEYADDHMTNQALEGTIDYYTKIEFDPNFELIQDKLNSADITWRLSSIQHEEDTGYIHYEWIWELQNG